MSNRLTPAGLTTSIFMGITMLGITTLSGNAQACGGLFCSASSPVNQAAERIIFAQDDENHITQIVEIAYSGEAERFAWVLPVPGTPKPGVSSIQVFDRLQAATNPTYQLQTTRKSCDFAQGAFGSSDDATSAEGGYYPDLPRVVVLDSGTVGPFNFDTISVRAGDSDPAEVAVKWLKDNEYDLGPTGADVLRPYLQNGLNLIAFKLTKGNSTGSIRPISLEYKAKEMSIPILPTAVAAQEDMPILVWLLGETRAVPTNYKSLELNELLIDWFNPAATYNLVVNAAADEAGGQGFVTEFAGNASPLSDVIVQEQEDVSGYNTQNGSIASNLIDLTTAFGNYDGYRDAVSKHLPLTSSEVEELLECPSCFFEKPRIIVGMGGANGLGSEEITRSEVEALLLEVEASVLGPIKEAAALLKKHKKVTRLYTTMSAKDMNLDPTFRFNPDLGDVSNVHTADQLIYCDDDFRITLPDGREVYGSGRTWPFVLGNSDMPANARVLQHSTTGMGAVTTDNRGKIDDAFDESDARKRGACSYAPGRSGQSPWALLVLSCIAIALLARRRNQLSFH